MRDDLDLGSEWTRNPDLECLRKHWGFAYQISAQGDQYVAAAMFGKRQRLAAHSPLALLEEIERNYPYPGADRCSL